MIPLLFLLCRNACDSEWSTRPEEATAGEGGTAARVLAAVEEPVATKVRVLPPEEIHERLGPYEPGGVASYARGHLNKAQISASAFERQCAIQDSLLYFVIKVDGFVHKVATTFDYNLNDIIAFGPCRN